jgi:hypothetical protein
MSNANNQILATETAIEASIRYVYSTEGVRAEGDKYALDPDPLAQPDAELGVTQGWLCGEVASVVGVTLSESPTGRVIYLVIGDPDAGPYTGAFTLSIAGETDATFTAAGDDLADVLDGWATAIESTLTGWTADVVSWIPDGTPDTIRVVGTTRDYAIDTGTVAPVDAQLQIVREAASCTADVRTQRGGTYLPVRSTASSNRQLVQWLAPVGGIGIPIPSEGYLEHYATGGCDRLHVYLYDPDFGADTIAVASGVSGVHWLPLVTVGPATASIGG